MALRSLIQALGPAISDPEEETFLLFAQPRTALDLGFVDDKATALELSVAGRDLSVTQSPGLLSSDRQQGTTGAVVWKITPLFAEWIAWEGNVLFISGRLNACSTVLELGCGVSGILPLVLRDKVSRYIATDQDYVFKLLKANLLENGMASPKSKNRTASKATTKGKNSSTDESVEVLALDWETNSASSVSMYLPQGSSIDLIIACDCIYNETLIEPFVSTCADICRLQSKSEDASKATICVVAQQLRSDLVFEAWLSRFSNTFTVRRMPDELLTEGLREGSGFVVHIGILKERS